MRRLPLVTAILPLALLVAGSPNHAEARDWRMIEDESSLAFTFRQMGSAVRGTFEDFTTDISFAPDDLENASVTTEISIDSVDTGNAERDAGIVGGDWFETATHPTAGFQSTDFTHQGGNDYLVTGELTIRGISESIELPMTISIDGNSATATGTIELDRRTFEVGRGDWATDSAVGYDVVLEIEVVAEAAD
jgi:polyisoprenoid-binding protein YceI